MAINKILPTQNVKKQSLIKPGWQKHEKNDRSFCKFYSIQKPFKVILLESR